MRRLREILRNEYIGAIAIGFLLFQAAGELINAVMQPIGTYFQNRSHPQSVFAGSQSIFNWPQIIFALIEMALHVLVAFLLLVWLYRRRKTTPVAVAASSPSVPAEQTETKP
ncbi:MAG TPA: hypothetical protein VKY85_08950 [Candidatus Angelobacter sp.]|nr:hypothetical protein [Candidatus Angelobacter sp.]